jgi:regulator of protease activity HflC (stomatin/prohibitin superfamily)
MNPRSSKGDFRHGTDADCNYKERSGGGGKRERQARIILGMAETEISEKFAQAPVVYENNPTALSLRAMNMLYEAIKEKGSMVIVPSSAVECMCLGGILGTASMGKIATGRGPAA